MLVLDSGPRKLEGGKRAQVMSCPSASFKKGKLDQAMKRSDCVRGTMQILSLSVHSLFLQMVVQNGWASKRLRSKGLDAVSGLLSFKSTGFKCAV